MSVSTVETAARERRSTKSAFDREGRYLGLTLVAVLVLLVLPPIWILLRTSLMRTRFGVAVDGWTIEHYANLASSSQLMQDFINTVLFSIGATTVSLLFGGVLAWLVVRTDAPFKALAFLQGFPASDAVRFPLWLSAVPQRDLDQLCHRDGASNGLFDYVEEFMAPLRDGTLQQKLLYYYQKSFLPEFVCMHTDRAAMQSSLEVRSPFLSLPLVEFANRLPDRFKMKNGNLKVLLRRTAAKRGLSADIVEQRKQGFTFPVARWLKTTLRSHAEALLSPDGAADELIDPSVVCRYVDDHMNGRRNNYRLLYHLIVFRAWRSNYPGLRFTG